MQHGIGAGRARTLRILDRRGGRVAARARNHIRAAAGDFDCQRNYALVFRFSHRGALARRAAGNQQAHAAFDLAVDERPHAIFINRAVSLERRHQRRRAATHPVNFHCHILFALCLEATARHFSVKQIGRAVARL